MKFTDFNNKTEVIKKFKLKFETREFLQKKTYDIHERDADKILKKFDKPWVFNCEYSICEAIIYPILSEVADANDLPIWSHNYFENKELDLSGTPDYLFALAEAGGEIFKEPVVCVGEAKQDKFTQAWGQIVAEMVAAQKLNGEDNENIPIYGLATNGKLWEFGVLINNTFTFHNLQYNTVKEFNDILDILNWIFSESRKNAETIDKQITKL